MPSLMMPICGVNIARARSNTMDRWFTSSFLMALSISAGFCIAPGRFSVERFVSSSSVGMMP